MGAAACPSSPCLGLPIEDIAHFKVEVTKNRAFVFIKPHAVTDKVRHLVHQKLADAGITVLAKGSIAAEEIDKKQLIDTHYGAIAAKAVKQKPEELHVQPEALVSFKSTFGIDWYDALDKQLVYNAADAARKLKIDFDALSEKWKKLQKDVSMLKFGGGFYVGKLGSIFVINGFYMDMRRAFTLPGASIYYLDVEWPAQHPSWACFRRKVIGGTDPKGAAIGSLRNLIYNEWRELGLKSQPNTTQNSLHASASPFEAMVERMNWRGASLSADTFGQALLARQIPRIAVMSWAEDPAVEFEGRRQSLFDVMEDLDVGSCLERSARIATGS